ncbi:tetratricopeptide repeat protein [Marinicauda salina]|nr:hypothetical protein [Marinicauda salina]
MSIGFLPKIAALSVAASLTAAAGAQAQECPAEPAFVAERTADRDVSASATRVDRGDWRAAAHFAREALEGGPARDEGAANVNLCAALANGGARGDVVEVCDAAVATSQDVWRAHTNRGAARWLDGDRAGAASDFARAAELAPGEAAVAHNQALAACSA